MFVFLLQTNIKLVKLITTQKMMPQLLSNGKKTIVFRTADKKNTNSM